MFLSSGQNKYKSISSRTKAVQSSFSPYCLEEWNNLSKETRNIESASKFKKATLSFIMPKEKSVFGIHYTNGIKLLNRLRLNFIHLNYHRFSHGFRDMIDPMYKCCKEVETTLHYLLRCNLHTFYRTELLNDIYAID